MVNKEKQSWLILSHGFNMDGRAASQTITDKIPYFLDAGIKLQVFSAITGVKDGRFPHKQLIAWGPSAFRFDFRHWMANRFGRGLMYKVLTPLVSVLAAPFIALEKIIFGYSSQWSWAFPVFFHGVSLVRSGKVNVVYSTGGAWSAHLAALWIRKLTGVLWVAEIHDPLVIRSNPSDLGLEIPKNRDARFRHWLEKQICRYASLAWWFTDGAMHYASLRNPNLNQAMSAIGIVVLPGSASSYKGSLDAGLINSDSAITLNHEKGPYLNISHFGSLSNTRSISIVLNSFSSLLRTHPDAKNKVKLHIYGADIDALAKDSIKRYGFEGMVIAHGRIEKDPLTGKTGREQIVEKMQNADVLLLLHGNDEWCAEYIPSKAYEYFWTHRPIWAITHRNQQLDDMLNERNAYVSHADKEKSIEDMISRIWLDWKDHKLNQPKWLPIGVDQASKEIMTAITSLKP